MFRKAQRTNAKLRLAITGTAGAGKTFSSILIAKGLGSGNIALIDSENGSGNLYAGMCDYDICQLSAPYDPRKYVQVIHEAEKEGYTTIIIDSLSHAWSGQGGILDLQAQITASMKSGNSYAAWRQVTPLQNRLVECILTSPCHIIATMRSKTDYAMDKNERGYTEIRKVGLAPVQREGMDYEFTTVFDLSQEHIAIASKDRTGLFGANPFTVDVHTGEILRDWLNTGADTQKGGEA